LSWLTFVALVAFVMVALIRPDDVQLAQLLFARSAAAFKVTLLGPAASTLRFETVTLLRAQLAADMMFLVAYGLLLRASIRALASTPLARLAPHGPFIVMIADAAENVSALKILRTLGLGTTPPSPGWFAAMNIAAATKWLVAGGVLLCLAVGWWREAARRERRHRLLPRLIAGAFVVGAVSSLAVTAGIATVVPQWVAATALMAPALALLLQFYLLDTITLMLRFLYLSRAPLIILLILAVFGPMALGPAVSLLGGILVAGNITGVAVTTAAAMAVAFACGTQISVVRAYAWQRVQDYSLRVLDHEVFASCVFWTGVVAASSLMFSVALVSLSLDVWQIAAGVVAGTMGALVFFFGIEWIAVRLSYTPPGYPSQELAVPFRRIRALAWLLNRAESARPPRRKRRFGGWFVSRLFGDESGYVEPLPRGGRRVLPGHTFAATQFVLTFAVFWLALYAKSRPGAPGFYFFSAAETDASFLAPTVTSIVLLLLLSGWALAGVAFFVDRYRTPLVTVALAAALTTGSWSRTDYVVPTGPESATSYQLATPGHVLKAFGDRPLVIAAAGGGIQAGAWTARVLRGLDEGLDGTLRRRVALISSVSGGSMGALYYGAFADDPTLVRVTEQALKPSLDEVATSFVGRDIFGVIGLRFGSDRGAALEDTWERRLPGRPKASQTLRSWSEAASDYASNAGRTQPFPAFLFNSTVVETGQPIVFATTQFPTPGYRTRIGEGPAAYPTVESANSILGLADGDAAARDVGLKAVTAARLSAAFPYVSPAAALEIHREHVKAYHLVDGGYYDFYGLVALSQWVDDALEELRRENQTAPGLIGVVIARGLVAADFALRDDVAPMDGTIALQGWRWQLTAPPVTALHARSYGQWAGGMQALRLLIGKWAVRGITITPILFDYPGKDSTPACQASPLSWKLTAPQQGCIESAWESFTQNHDLLPASLM